MSGQAQAAIVSISFRLLLLATVTCLLTLPSELLARSSSGSHHTSGSSVHTSSHGSSHSKATPGLARDKHGRIQRSAAAKDQFKKAHPCPSTGKSRGACPGYVIDHVTPLKRGGRDAPENMQWQTVRDAKIKDQTE